ncbi:MAG: molybdate ABC transporter substrate-binding protein [Ilumatobacteraceae bacterium]
MRRRSVRLLAALALGALLVACGSDEQGGDGGGVTGSITVGAASSLTASFTELGDAFEGANPGVDVTFDFGASSEVVQGINEGAPTDVFASADTKNMDKLVAGAGVAADPQVFATNQLQIIVGKGNPQAVTGVADLANPDLLVVACSPEVPIGGYTQQVFDAAGVKVTPVSLEENVKSIVTKVTLGEADAGVVYRTDVIAAADKAEGVDIPADINVTAKYPIAVTKDAANATVANAFVAFVLSPDGQTILQKYGFGAP